MGRNAPGKPGIPRASGLALAGALSIGVGGAQAQSSAEPPAPVGEKLPAAATDANVVAYPFAFFTEFRPITALDMIGRIPGFAFDGGSSARGISGTVGNVLIDGERPLARGDSLSSILSRVPAGQVVRIDVVRGGAGGIDMGGKPVVANVIRRPDAGVSGAASASLSVTRDGDLGPGVSLQAQRQRNGRSYEGALRLNTGGQSQFGERLRLSPDGEVLLRAETEADIDFSSGEATAVYEGPMVGGRVRANGLLNFNASLSDGLDLLAVPGGRERSLSDSERYRGEAGLRYTRSLPRGMSLEVVGVQQATRDRSVGSYDTPSFTSDTVTDRTSAESILGATVDLPPVGDWTMETGAEVAFNFVETQIAFGFNNAALLLPGGDTRVEELRGEGVFTGIWSPGATLSVELGLRYELSRLTATGDAGESESVLAYPKPRLNLAWSPAPGHQLNLEIERTVDQLSFGAFAASASFATGIFGRGNPELRPAQVWSAEGRYERIFWERGSFTAELTLTAVDDLLGQVVVVETPPGATMPVAFTITRNVGSAVRGQARVAGRLPLDRYGIEGGLLSGEITLRTSSTEDPVTFVERRLASEQPFSWSVGFTRNLQARNISFSVNASSGQDVLFFGPRTLSRFRSDPNLSVSVSWRPDPKLSLSGGASLGGASFNDFTLFGAPRDVGLPLYDERGFTRGSAQAFVSLRRSF